MDTGPKPSQRPPKRPPANPTATAAPFALDPKSAMDKPLAGEILLSKEDFAEQAQKNFRNARDAYEKQKHKVTKATSLFAPTAEKASSGGGQSPVKPAPFALDPTYDEAGPQKKMEVDEFMEQARSNFLASKAAYDAQKAKVRKSSM